MKHQCKHGKFVLLEVIECKKPEGCWRQIKLSHGKFCNRSPFVEGMHDRCPNKNDCKKECQEGKK